MLQPYKIMKELEFERLAGGPGEEKAIAIIGGHLRDLGLSYTLEPFDIYGFFSGNAKLIASGKEFPLVPYGLNRDCLLEGELVFLENADVLLYNKGAYEGKIVLGYKFSRGLNQAIEEANLKAYIVIGNPQRPAPSYSHRQASYQKGMVVPSFTIDYNEAVRLARLSGTSVTIECQQKVEKRTANNIVVNIPGKKADKNAIYLVGHYDTVARTAGSSDNTGGTVTLLAAAENLAKQEPGRNVKIVFFSGEELGLLGSSAFVEKHKDELKNYGRLCINVDVTGDELGHNLLAVIGNKNLLGYVNGITKEAGLMFESKLDIYSSDCMPFTVYEIPSVNISRFGGRASFNIHTPDDAAKYCSANGLKDTIAATKLLLRRVADAKIFPVEKEIDKELREKIEKYLYNLAYQEPKLEWTPTYKK